MKVAAIQMSSNNDKISNLNKAVELVNNAVINNAQLILLPEVFNYRGSLNLSYLKKNISEYAPGESLKPFMRIARKNKIHILAGSIYENSKNNKKIYNTTFIINDYGEIECKYRKINLFKAFIDGKKIDESQIFRAGKKPITCTVKNFKVGLSICYDLRFPELYRYYYKKKVDIICIPSSFTKKTGELHWEILLRARAIENHCYIIAPNQYGIDGNKVNCFGNSMIINPLGDIIAKLGGDDESIAYAEITKKNNKTIDL